MQKEKLIKVKITEIKPISGVYKHQYICTEKQSAFFPDGGKRWKILKSSEDATHIFEYPLKAGRAVGYCKGRGIWKCSCGNYFKGEKGELCDVCLLRKYGLELKRHNYSVNEEYDFDYYKEEDVIKALRKASGGK